MLQIIRHDTQAVVGHAPALHDAINLCGKSFECQLLEILPMDGSLTNWWYCLNGTLYDPVQYRPDPEFGIVELFKADATKSIHGSRALVSITYRRMLLDGIVVVIHDELASDGSGQS